MESIWLNWCRLCAKDDVSNNVQVYTDENASTWNGVLIMAIGKYFNVHMQLKDGISGVLCNECYTLISDLINYGKHVNKAQTLFETLRCFEPGSDVESVRQQCGLRKEDWTHIMKPSLELDNNELMQSDGQETNQELIDFVDCSEIFQQSQTLGNSGKTNVNHLPIEEITIPGGNAVNSCKAFVEQTVEIGEIESYSTSLKDDLELHPYDLDKSTKRRKLECPRCAKVYRYPGSFKKHLQLNCRKKEKRSKVDKRFNKTLSSASSFTQHQEILQDDLELMHASFHPDHASSSEGKNDYDLDKPVKRKKLECPTCAKVYRNPGSFKKHLQLNCRKKEKRIKVDKSFYCKLCNKTLSSASSLKKHQESVHSNFTYVCDHCGEQLKTIKALNDHKRNVHSEDHKFKCNLCDAKFKRSQTLKRHILSHKGLRPYVCNYCDKTYACKTQLGYHKRKKHPNEFKKEEPESSMCTLKLPTLNELMSKMPNPDLEEVNVCS